MSKEKETVELKDEELEKVTGGGFQPGEGPTVLPPNSVEEGFYCPDCGLYITLNSAFKDGGVVFCPTCNKDVKPRAKKIP